MAKLVSKTYSEALFEVALEEEKIDLFLQELEFIIETFKTYPEFHELFKSPLVKVNEKKEVLNQVFGDKLSKEMTNFLKIILDKSRAHYIEPIKWEYERMVNRHKGIVKAVATTAIPLSDEEKMNLQNKLSNLTGKNIKLINEIDRSLLGGVLVRIEDKVIDGTIKGRLDDMKESLSKIIV